MNENIKKHLAGLLSAIQDESNTPAQYATFINQCILHLYVYLFELAAASVKTNNFIDKNLAVIDAYDLVMSSVKGVRNDYLKEMENKNNVNTH